MSNSSLITGNISSKKSRNLSADSTTSAASAVKLKPVLIIDFGSQVTQLIARRIREMGVYCEIASYNLTIESIIAKDPVAIIFSGGPASVYELNAPSVDAKIFDLNLPILGICYGQQIICHLLGGEVLPAKQREFGKAILQPQVSSPLFDTVTDYQIWMSHGDFVNQIPQGFTVIATTENAPFAVIANESKKIYGLQFHPEVYHSNHGHLIIKNFIFNIAKASVNWTMNNFLQQEIASIRQKVGKDHVILGLSGGVDSSVVAALVEKAIGSQLTCIFVNHGMLRKNEAQEVQKAFGANFKGNLIVIDATDLFAKKLSKIADPEKKRKIIGKTFIEVFNSEAIKLAKSINKGSKVKFLAQGTLYPDVIESTHPNDGASQTIKSHHNVGGLPKRMKLQLLEPLRMLFKDEVRELGKQLALPESLIMRHPFPGPGLAIRIIGDITAEKIRILQLADEIYINELKKSGLYQKIWQAFAVLLPVKTVGVMGDCRTYENVLALRAVTSVDGMTADIYHFESQFLAMVAGKIINEVKGVNRVVYDFTSKPPGTIEWE